MLVCERVPELAGILQVRSNAYACAIDSEQTIGVGKTAEHSD